MFQQKCTAAAHNAGHKNNSIYSQQVIRILIVALWNSVLLWFFVISINKSAYKRPPFRNPISPLLRKTHLYNFYVFKGDYRKNISWTFLSCETAQVNVIYKLLTRRILKCGCWIDFDEFSFKEISISWMRKLILEKETKIWEIWEMR